MQYPHIYRITGAKLFDFEISSSIENSQYCPSAKLALLIVYALNEQFENVFYLDVPD